MASISKLPQILYSGTTARYLASQVRLFGEFRHSGDKCPVWLAEHFSSAYGTAFKRAKQFRDGIVVLAVNPAYVSHKIRGDATYTTPCLNKGSFLVLPLPRKILTMSAWHAAKADAEAVMRHDKRTLEYLLNNWLSGMPSRQSCVHA